MSNATPMTVDSANKRIRLLNTERSRILNDERQSMTYAHGQNEEPFIPEYSFTETQAKLAAINDEIVELKHAVNQFNTTHTVPGTELTIDKALVRLPQLNELKSKLETMRTIQPKTRRTLLGSNGVSEFTVRNFDAAEVEALYTKTCEEIVLIQQGLSSINLTETL